jgi:hypothetical protein
MSYVLRVVRPANIQSYVATNAAGSLKDTARESWRAYLVAQGATGQSISQLEFSFLTAQPGNTLQEKWGNYANATAGGSTDEKVRNLIK